MVNINLIHLLHHANDQIIQKFFISKILLLNWTYQLTNTTQSLIIICS